MKTKQTNRTSSIVQIDKSLDQYANKILFPNKVKEATEMLKKVGLPEKREQKSSESETETTKC